MTTHPLRLIEVDLPIARISAHARREKSIRHGHISTLHIWWARRPLAACRAVILASLWPDPVDLARGVHAKPVKPARFLDEARSRMQRWAETSVSVGGSDRADDFRRIRPVSPESVPNMIKAKADPKWLGDPTNIRAMLLDFIADFANWDNSTDKDYLETARALTQAAHEALGGEPGTRPLVIDPFAGGGSIPLEALRVGADAFASDLNPIPVLLNKVVLEYIPKYGQRLADEVRKWGAWIKEEAEKELAAYYPKDKDGSTPIAYLWARTILSEAPGQGDIPVEVPLMRSLWLAKKAGRKRALRWVRDDKGKVKTQTVEVAYVEDGQRILKRVKRPLLEIFEPKKDTEVEVGTVARGCATCPVTGFTTKVDRVRAQLRSRRGGAADSRLFCVVTTREEEQGRFYRLPTKADQEAFDAAAVELERREKEDGTQRSQKGRKDGEGIAAGQGSRRSLVPDEVISLNELRRVSVPIYGLERWGDLFSPRQSLALVTMARLVREVGAARDAIEPGLAEGVMTSLGFCIDKLADKASTLCGWKPNAEYMAGNTFRRQAIGMMWDYCEANVFGDVSGDIGSEVEWVAQMIEHGAASALVTGHSECASATNHPLPDDAAAALITDPPYYDAVPYAYLSDFFYVWMRRTLAGVHPLLFRDGGVPKDAEIVVDRPHSLSKSTKDIAFYERQLTKAFAEGRRVLAPSGVGTIVFASKTTASWEAILKAVIDAGFIITGSWPIDTEMENRVSAQGQARLGSSVHIVVRPRENASGEVKTGDVGEWRSVLEELPRKIRVWMPRLEAEGVVGADAIFACIGPALEVYSRYSRVERASGEAVLLPEYLEHVWATVSTEALSLIFSDADAGGLEPDARLTAMWLWTLGSGKKPGEDADASEDEADDDEEDSARGGGKSTRGFALEFDAARKIAQGLGVHLEKCESFVEVRGETARLLSVAERVRYLFGKDATVGEGPAEVRPKGKKKKAEANLFETTEQVKAEIEKAEAEAAGKLAAAKAGATAMDRVHQAMLLFSTGRGEALRRFVVDDGVGKDARFWKLADSLSKLYPSSSEEKRWVDGVLARKKSFGY